MGILSSDRIKIFGLQTKGEYWSAQSDAATGSYVQCENFRLLVLCVVSKSTTPNISVLLNGLDDSEFKSPAKCIDITNEYKESEGIVSAELWKSNYYLVDISCAKSFRLKKNTDGYEVNVTYALTQGCYNDYLSRVRKKESENEEDVPSISKFIEVFESESISVSYWDELNTGKQLRATLGDVWVWSSKFDLFVSIDGKDGEQHEIALTSANFPNIKADSTIVKVGILPFIRNDQKKWRIVVITNQGQIYHNFPSRATNGEGVELDGDYLKFDESVVWDLPERWTPVKTNSGNDSSLISTGKYKYFPCYENVAYEMHPPISADNGYGNGGFAAIKTDGGETRSRFFVHDRIWWTNSFDFMGGFAPDEMMTMIGTYRNNRESGGNYYGVRTCVFATNDGGRQWYCVYEFGPKGRCSDIDGNGLGTIEGDYCGKLSYVGAVSGGQYKVQFRTQIIPSEKDKEPNILFRYSSEFNVTSISGSSSAIVVSHDGGAQIKEGDVVCFKKSSGSTDSSFSWIVNESCSETSGGNGVFFRAHLVNSNSFELYGMAHNPYNNLPTRHIHSIDRGKDGYAISCGEQYPHGWMMYISQRESDYVGQIQPWNKMQVIRLNSARNSVQRPLGFYLDQDKDNTLFVGVDNDFTDIGTVQMPEGRTDVFRRSSNGVVKGSLVDIDDASKFEMILPVKEVCYFFKNIQGVFIYIGVFGLIAVSYDKGKSWSQGRIPREMIGELSHYGGVSNDRNVVIDNLVIKLKK